MSTVTVISHPDVERQVFYNTEDFLVFMQQVWKTNEDFDTNIRSPKTYEEALFLYDVLL